mgnify:CR=1 FL=1
MEEKWEEKWEDIEKRVEEERKVQKLGFIYVIIIIISYSILLAVSVTLYHSNTNELLIQETEYKNVYELKDKSWFLIDRENNKYIFQPIELGDWDYELNSEEELKNIIATYFMNKYNTNENEIINNINKVFKTIE